MKKTLHPFAQLPLPLDFTVEFVAFKESMEITYQLLGDLEKINLVDGQLGPVTRTDELWKNTCFEWFLKPRTAKNYWEFNAAPTGQWNFYELKNYRLNLQPCELIQTPRFSSQLNRLGPGRFEFLFKVEIVLKTMFEINPILPVEGQLGITSVIQWKSGETSYFSLKHPSEKPDFHANENFQINYVECLNV